jgi:type VI secretion system protein VasG
MGRMVRDEGALLSQLDQTLAARIRGQDGALSILHKGILTAKAHLGNPASPMGVFLLAGPSGVGKTETATALSDLLFGGERFMITVNMSEFQEKHSVARLIGSPPGYVGYGEGGVLTEAVRQRPYSVVLLDEIEKADLEVMNLFYQVFDKGTLSDGEGRDVDFRNTVILMTTNLGSREITDLAEQGQVDLAAIKQAITPLLASRLKPALLARMTVVPYLPLDDSILADVTRMKLGHLADRLRDYHGIALHYTDAIVRAIVERCDDVDTGARAVDHILNGSLSPMIAAEVLKRMGDKGPGDHLTVDILPNGTFSLHFQGVETVAEVVGATAGDLVAAEG